MILHVDMDAFYAAVEQRDRPELRGRPVIVGGLASGRGVVCAASYEARKFGVHSAMPAATARRLCPEGVFVAPRMETYAAVSYQIREIFHRYTPLVEPLSLDEAFLDVTGSQQLFGSAERIGHRIKQDIRQELSLVASVGVAPNKFLAKIASDLEKPDAFVYVAAETVQQFLDPLPVGRLWGVGRITNQFLARSGIRTIRQLRELPAGTLEKWFGEQGHHLWMLAHGRDDREVVPDRSAKSLSHESTFPVDIREREVIESWLLELSDQVGRRLRRIDLRAKSVHIKVRYASFRTVTRSVTLEYPTSATADIGNAALQLYRERIDASHPPIRLLGVGTSQFANDVARQQSLFPTDGAAAQRRLDKATDAIREKFGDRSLARGSRLLHLTQRQQDPPAPA